MKAIRFVPLAVLAPLLLATAAATVWIVATVWASFTPAASVELSSYNSDDRADITSSFALPTGDVNYDAVVTYTPPEWGVAADADIEDGAAVGTLDAAATLGLINNPCTTPVNVTYDLMDATTDMGTEFAEAGDIGHGTWNGYDPVCPGGKERAVCQWPGFVSELFPGLTPRARYYGHVFAIGGMHAIVNILLFEPGASLPDYPPFPTDWGYGSLAVLNDPTVGEPPSVTDFCTPLVSDNTINGIASGSAVLRTNPQYGGTYIFRSWLRGARDNDGDSYENGIDTCPAVANLDGDPRSASVLNPDMDAIDSACDPDPTGTCGPGTDDDSRSTDCDADGHYNRRDNCPFDVNEDQEDADEDGLGDACDPDPAIPFGDPSRPEATIEMPVEIMGPPPPSAADYGVVNLVPPSLSFANPGRFGFKLAVFYAKVQNLGAAPDGPASLSLQLEPVNTTCPAPLVLPVSPYSLTLAPGDQTQRLWLVFFFRCGDPSPPEDYIATATISAPGDTNPDNDALSATVNVRRR